MTRILTTLSILLLSATAFGFAGTFENDTIPDQINDIQLHVFNYAETAEGRAACGSSQCFRVKVILNGDVTAVWPVSPGKPHYGTKHVGIYTPEYNGRSIHSTHVYGRNYTSYKYKYSMPYVMYMRSSTGSLTGVGFHAGVVDGTRLSHGCIRMRMADVKELNSWVREAFANGGDVRVWSRGTRP